MSVADHNQYNFDQRIDRRNSDSIKWNYYPSDVIPMWIADMDFVSPQPVLQALHERIEHGIFGYHKGIFYSPNEVSLLQQVTHRQDGKPVSLGNKSRRYRAHCWCSQWLQSSQPQPGLLGKKRCSSRLQFTPCFILRLKKRMYCARE